MTRNDRCIKPTKTIENASNQCKSKFKVKPVQNGPIKWLIDNSINSTLTYFKISVWQLKFQQ